MFTRLENKDVSRHFVINVTFCKKTAENCVIKNVTHFVISYCRILL